MIILDGKGMEELYIGSMGIQEALLGDDSIYTREASYCFIELSTLTENQIKNI